MEIFSNPLRRDPPTALTSESGLPLAAAVQNFSHSHGTQKNAKIWDVHNLAELATSYAQHAHRGSPALDVAYQLLTLGSACKQLSTGHRNDSQLPQAKKDNSSFEGSRSWTIAWRGCDSYLCQQDAKLAYSYSAQFGTVVVVWI